MSKQAVNWIFVGMMLSGSVQGKEISSESARDFTEVNATKTSIGRKMVAFEMPPEYECPLFSNSPYTEVLVALDKMQDNLNTVFPQCRANNERMTSQSSELRNKIVELQNMEKTGQTFKLSMSADAVVQLTQQMQQSLSTVANAQTEVCYNSNQQFRSVIFSMNETFQSLAPVVLDLATKNPLLAQSLGPALKVLAGADNISKGITFIEQISKDSEMIKMSVPENRVNTIKNVCQFMKLYRRLEYMRMSKIDQVQSIQTEFQTKIADLSKKISDLKSKSNVPMAAAAAPAPVAGAAYLIGHDARSKGAMSASTTTTYEDYKAIKNSVVLEIEKIQKALMAIEQAKKQYNNPEIPQCNAVKLAEGSESLQTLIDTVAQFNEGYKRSEEIESLLQTLSAFKKGFNEVQSDQHTSKCVSIGQDILNVTNQLLESGRKSIAEYEIEMVELNDGRFAALAEQSTINKKEKSIRSEEADLKKLKVMLEYAAFESSEVEKRAKGMHRYFFAGPGVLEFKGKCDDGKPCTAGFLKAKYQWYKNKGGPIHALLLDNEEHFEYAFNNMISGMRKIQAFEKRFVLKQFGGAMPKAYPTVDQYNQYNQDLNKAYADLPHLTSEFLVKGTSDHRIVCESANVVLEYYMVATQHVMSTEGMCNMIYPALKETEVSSELKNYCQVSKKLGNENPSKLHQLIYRLVGRDSGEKAEIKGTAFSQSPKAFVAKILEKYNDLGCEQTSSL